MSKTINISFVGDDGQIWYADGYVDYQLKEKDKKIETLQNDLDRANSKLKESIAIRLKAIEYLESYNTDFKNCRFGEAPISIRELGDLLDILKGVDKE